MLFFADDLLCVFVTPRVVLLHFVIEFCVFVCRILFDCDLIFFFVVV
jgi:hypothetical protein